MRTLGQFVFLALFFLSVLAWLFAWVLFKAAGGMIHLLLLFTAVSFVLHLFQGRRAA
jgi:hypothetical protein